MRIDLDDLERILNSIDTKKQKLIGVVAIFGTTETGAIDDISKILELTKRLLG